MKLRTVVFFIDLSYGVFTISGCLAVAACIFYLRNGWLFAGIAAAVMFFILAFFWKKILINFYLKRCKYPYEFLSVLGQLNLLNDLQVVWQDGLSNEPAKAAINTDIFMTDNGLSRTYGTSDSGKFLSFTEEGLVIEKKIYKWEAINSWEAITGDHVLDRLEIKYFDIDGKEKKAVINLAYINAASTDLLLLMTHFKAKHGFKEGNSLPGSNFIT